MKPIQDNRDCIISALCKYEDEIWTTESCDSDIFLEHLFVHLDTFDKLFRGKRYVVKSRKGTGKSSLKQYFTATSLEEGGIPIELNFNKVFDSEFFDKIESLRKTEGGFRKYSDIIRFSLLVEIGRQLSKCIQDENSEQLYVQLSGKYLPKTLTNNGKINLSWSTKIKSGALIASFLEAEATASGGDGNSQKTEEISLDFNKLISPLQQDISRMAKGKKVSILVDDTDKEWFNYREIYAQFISSFVSSVDSLNEEFDFGKNGPKIILFIRSDLFEAIRNIPQGNIAKIIEDKLVEIDWGKNEKFYTIIRRRLQYVFDIEKIENFPLTLKDLIHFYFPDKQTDDFLSKILNWTYLRPRDLVILAKKVIESDGNENILRALYSTWFKTEVISDECAGYLENQADAISRLRKLPKQFQYSDFLAQFADFPIKLQDGGDTPDELLRYLLFQSYIGVVTLEKNPFFSVSMDKKYHFAYREYGKIPEYTKDESFFCFHEGFYMAITQSR